MRRSWGTRQARAAAVVAACFGVFAPAVDAQMVGPRLSTRAQLEAMLDSLQQVSTMNMSEEGRRRLQLEVSGLALRLQNGDVAAGDQVRLSVSGVDKWSGQFAVTGERRLELPDIDAIDLSGLLYAEVEEAIAQELSRYVREPRIRVEVLKRIGVTGAVGSPGFYAVSGSVLVSDVLMTAGGPASNANLDKVTFRRQGVPISLDRPGALWESLTLDQLGLVSGDEVVVPQKSGVSFWVVFSAILGLATTITLLITRL